MVICLLNVNFIIKSVEIYSECNVYYEKQKEDKKTKEERWWLKFRLLRRYSL
jgi:hypothetical protein